MQSIKAVLRNFDPVKDKYVSREFQTFGLKLAEDLNDYQHRSLYMKLAKTVHRSILEQALSFCVDSNVDKKGALFMWKLQQLRGKSPSTRQAPIRQAQGGQDSKAKTADKKINP